MHVMTHPYYHCRLPVDWRKDLKITSRFYTPIRSQFKICTSSMCGTRWTVTSAAARFHLRNLCKLLSSFETLAMTKLPYNFHCQFWIYSELNHLYMYIYDWLVFCLFCFCGFLGGGGCLLRYQNVLKILIKN